MEMLKLLLQKAHSTSFALSNTDELYECHDEHRIRSANTSAYGLAPSAEFA